MDYSINVSGGERFAALETVSYDGLRQNQPTAIAELVEACSSQGFFYLDFSSNQSLSLELRCLLQELEDLAERLFDSNDPEKQLYNMFAETGKNKTSGFKTLGTEVGALRSKADGFELFTTPQNGLLLPELFGPWDRPDLIKHHEALLMKYTRLCNEICMTVLRCLFQPSNPEYSYPILDFHSPNILSPTSLSFLKYPPVSTDRVGHVAHTDAGSLTLLHSTQYGLQICVPGQIDEWHFVAPRDNSLVVNIGDCLTFLSGGTLKSSLHRVMPCPHELATTRYSVCYFLRPNDDCQVLLRDGKTWSSKEWLTTKFTVFAASHGEQAKHASILSTTA